MNHFKLSKDIVRFHTACSSTTTSDKIKQHYNRAVSTFGKPLTMLFLACIPPHLQQQKMIFLVKYTHLFFSSPFTLCFRHRSGIYFFNREFKQLRWEIFEWKSFFSCSARPLLSIHAQSWWCSGVGQKILSRQ